MAKKLTELEERVSMKHPNGEWRTISNYLTASGFYAKEKYLIHEGGYLMFGRRVVRALNGRIIMQAFAIRYYDARLTEYKVGRQNPSTLRKVERLEAERAKEVVTLQHYKDERAKVYYQVDQLLRDKPEMYKSVFKWCYLEGLSIHDIVEKYKIDQKTVESAVKLIREDMFEEEEIY